MSQKRKLIVKRESRRWVKFSTTYQNLNWVFVYWDIYSSSSQLWRAGSPGMPSLDIWWVVAGRRKCKNGSRPNYAPTHLAFKPSGIMKYRNTRHYSSWPHHQGVCGLCLKGPGDICGGLGDQYGVCGAGLVCSSCNRCQMFWRIYLISLVGVDTDKRASFCLLD